MKPTLQLYSVDDLVFWSECELQRPSGQPQNAAWSVGRMVLAQRRCGFSKHHGGVADGEEMQERRGEESRLRSVILFTLW